MIMKKLIVPILLALSLLVSCGPSRYALNVEMRYPSSQGIDLAGKLISVIYLENEDTSTTALNAALAEAFTSSLETELNSEIGVYSVRASQSGDYSNRDSLFALLIETGADLVFFFDSLTVSAREDASYDMKLYCFDGMNREEKVHNYASHIPGDMKPAEMGAVIASYFKSQWKHEQYSLYYFEDEKWIASIDKASRYNWKEAMDIWFGFLNSADELKRSCAEYNIAVACYMLGDFHLALEWLNRSDEECRLANSDSLRKRISARIGN